MCMVLSCVLFDWWGYSLPAAVQPPPWPTVTTLWISHPAPQPPSFAAGFQLCSRCISSSPDNTSSFLKRDLLPENEWMIFVSIPGYRPHCLHYYPALNLFWRVKMQHGNFWLQLPVPLALQLLNAELSSLYLTGIYNSFTLSFSTHPTLNLFVLLLSVVSQTSLSPAPSVS